MQNQSMNKWTMNTKGGAGWAKRPEASGLP